MNLDIEEAKRVLDIEIRALTHLRDRLSNEFVKGVELLMETKGKVILTGVGKSGHIGRKIASTLSSTGTPALYIHPTESSHGDLGVIADGDLVIAISYSGEATELGDLIAFCARRGIPLIAMTSKSASPLAEAASVVLDISVSEEACPLKLAPTSSSTTTLALGDAMAMALLKRKGFQEKDFAEYHPGGALGRKLLTRVGNVMNTDDELPLVGPETPVSEVIVVMTGYGKGTAAVVNDSGELIGAITDGDIRRCVGKTKGHLTGTAKDILSPNPKTVEAGELAQKALFLMEQFRINLLFVVDSQNGSPKKPVGVLHIQDLMRANIR
ncbi:MAG: KpsF/GutQ family sugar-phosphate isomerase [Pseudomonadota bacterium]